MKQVLEKRKDIAFYIKLYPLKMHQDSYRKAKAIQCEKSLQLLEAAFEKKSIPDPTCEMSVMANPIDNNIRLAEKLGIMGTPAMVLESGTLVRGLIKAGEIISLIDSNK